MILYFYYNKIFFTKKMLDSHLLQANVERNKDKENIGRFMRILGDFF